MNPLDPWLLPLLQLLLRREISQMERDRKRVMTDIYVGNVILGIFPTSLTFEVVVSEQQWPLLYIHFQWALLAEALFLFSYNRGNGRGHKKGSQVENSRSSK